MNFVKILSLFSLCVIFSYQAHSQTHDSKSYKLIVNLENAPIDSLYLHDYTEGRDILIAGKKMKKNTWEITIPDNIVLDYETMELVVSQYDSISNSSTLIRFITEKDGKKIIVANVGVEDKINYIHGTYKGKTIFPNERIRVKIHNKDSLIVGNIIYEDFNLIVNDPKSDIAVRAKDPFFSWFGEDMSYYSYLASYVELSKKYPDSRFLMTYLSLNVNTYKSKKDVEHVYKSLSDKHKNTLWAKNIELFLYNKKFQNTSLPTVYKDTYEQIVQDTSKFNLIIFSASWCAPCIEEIPLLKEIYKDLSKNLIFTYVSIDNEKGVASFKNLTREKNIDWRTLFAYQDVKKIKQKYFIEGIPYNILIYPNGDMEKIDVRIDEQRAKLYSICKPQTN